MRRLQNDLGFMLIPAVLGWFPLYLLGRVIVTPWLSNPLPEEFPVYFWKSFAVYLFWIVVFRSVWKNWMQPGPERLLFYLPVLFLSFLCYAVILIPLYALYPSLSFYSALFAPDLGSGNIVMLLFAGFYIVPVLFAEWVMIRIAQKKPR
jgi:hypothetical protein